jgi:hypothetical protein
MTSSSIPCDRGTRPRAPSLPTPQELIAAPELAVLASLEHAIELTSRMLVAAHPELIGERSHLHPLDLQATFAQRLLHLAMLLTNATTRYQAAVFAALHEPDSVHDDIPF